MPGRNLALFIPLFLLSAPIMSADLDHTVSGDEEIEDVLGSSQIKGQSPFIVEGEPSDNVEKSKPNGVDSIFNHGVTEVTESKDPKKKFEDFGYTAPGTFEKQENYIEVDKLKMTREFRKSASGGMNLTFIKNGYDYKSDNDIINRTLNGAYKSIKGGSLHFRHDSYITKTMLLHAYWSAGLGVGFSSGRGIFVDGTQSTATFKLWEVPIDLGVGMEVPLASWFKIAGTGGPSIMGLVQNRSDYERGEKGKRKIQYSYGYFASGQFKINLSGLSKDAAYELFTTSQITNLFMNLEARVQNYENFQDNIQITGTSVGIGFTFEYL